MPGARRASAPPRSTTPPEGPETAPRCAHCGATLDVLARLRRLAHCGASACRRVADERALAQRRAAVAADAVRAARATGAAADARAVLWLHHVPGRLAATTRRDRDQLAQALTRRAAEMASTDATSTATVRALPGDDDDRPALPSAAPADEPPPQAGALCALCRGHCCRHGLGQHAFIDATLLARWRSAHPGSSAGQAIEAYLSWLPRHHVAGSCLFHGAQGCTIPRAHRSDTCNAYACDTLRRLRQRLADEDGATVALAVTMAAAQPRRAALLDRASSRPLTWRGGPRPSR